MAEENALHDFKKIFDEELEKYAKDYDYPDIAVTVLGHSDVRTLCYEVCKRIKLEDHNG